MECASVLGSRQISDSSMSPCGYSSDVDGSGVMPSAGKRPKIAEDLLISRTFDSRKQFIDQIKASEFGTRNGYNLKISLKDGKDVGGKVARLVCTGCSQFFVLGRSSIVTNKFCIIDCCFKHYSIIDGHEAPCTGGTSVTATATMVAQNPIVSALLQMPKNHDHARRIGTEIVQTALACQSVPMKATKDVVKKGIAELGITKEEHERGYEKLEAWLECLVDSNPGMRAKVERFVEDDSIDYVAMAFPYVTEDLLLHLMPIYAIDSAHMEEIKVSQNLKFGKFKLFGLVGRTLGNHNLPLSIVICRHENTKAVQALLEIHSPAVVEKINQPNIIVTCDGSPAILAIFQQGMNLDQVHLLRCQHHLEMNIKGFEWHQQLPLFKRARNTVTRSESNQVLETLKQENEKMHTWLTKGVQHWQLCEIVEAGLMAYALHSDNQVEQFFSWTSSYRNLSPFFFLRQLCMKVFSIFAKHQQETMKWSHVLTPLAKRTFDRNRMTLRDAPTRLVVGQPDGKRFNVTYMRHTQARSEVFVVENGPHGGWRCSCEMWSQTGVPCEHGLCVLEFLGITTEPDKLYTTTYFHRLSFTTTLKQMYHLVSEPGGFVCPADSSVAHKQLSKSFRPLVPVYVPIETTLDTRRIRSKGEGKTKGTVSRKQYAMEKKPCRYCGKVLAPKSFQRHQQNTEECNRYGVANPAAKARAAKYYADKFEIVSTSSEMDLSVNK